MCWARVIGRWMRVCCVLCVVPGFFTCAGESTVRYLESSTKLQGGEARGQPNSHGAAAQCRRGRCSTVDGYVLVLAVLPSAGAGEKQAGQRCLGSDRKITITITSQRQSQGRSQTCAAAPHPGCEGPRVAASGSQWWPASAPPAATGANQPARRR